MKAKRWLTRSHALIWCYVSWGSIQWLPRAWRSALSVCVCVRMCAHNSSENSLCECVDANGSNGLKGTGWAVTRSVPWPHTLTLNIFPSSFPTSSIWPPQVRSPTFIYFVTYFIYLIGISRVLFWALSHVGFPRSSWSRYSFQDESNPWMLSCFSPLFISSCTWQKKTLVLKDRIKLFTNYYWKGFIFIFGHKASVITQQFGWL